MDHGERPEFRWLERGEGEPVLLLHGLMGQMHHWDGVLDGLADHCRPIALSLPIFDRALPSPTIHALARHVVHFLDALGITRAVVGGNSLGGHVALEVALQHPQRVSGLILTGSSGLFARTFTRGVPRRPTVEYIRAKLEEVFYDRSLVTDGWVAAASAIVTTPASARRVVRFARAAKRANLENRLGAIAVPSLLVWGREDRITPPEAAQRFHALLPDAQLWFLARCGHAPMLERPEAFAEIVAGWLGDPRRRSLAREPQLGGLR